MAFASMSFAREVTVVGLDMLPARAEPSIGAVDADILELDRALAERTAPTATQSLLSGPR